MNLDELKCLQGWVNDPVETVNQIEDKILDIKVKTVYNQIEIWFNEFSRNIPYELLESTPDQTLVTIEKQLLHMVAMDVGLNDEVKKWLSEIIHDRVILLISEKKVQDKFVEDLKEMQKKLDVLNKGLETKLAESRIREIVRGFVEHAYGLQEITVHKLSDDRYLLSYYIQNKIYHEITVDANLLESREAFYQLLGENFDIARQQHHHELSNDDTDEEEVESDDDDDDVSDIVVELVETPMKRHKLLKPSNRWMKNTIEDFFYTVEQILKEKYALILNIRSYLNKGQMQFDIYYREACSDSFVAVKWDMDSTVQDIVNEVEKVIVDDKIYNRIKLLYHKFIIYFGEICDENDRNNTHSLLVFRNGDTIRFALNATFEQINSSIREKMLKLISNYLETFVSVKRCECEIIESKNAIFEVRAKIEQHKTGFLGRPIKFEFTEPYRGDWIAFKNACHTRAVELFRYEEKNMDTSTLYIITSKLREIEDDYDKLCGVIEDGFNVKVEGNDVTLQTYDDHKLTCRIKPSYDTSEIIRKITNGIQWDLKRLIDLKVIDPFKPGNIELLRKYNIDLDPREQYLIRFENYIRRTMDHLKPLIEYQCYSKPALKAAYTEIGMSPDDLINRDKIDIHYLFKGNVCRMQFELMEDFEVDTSRFKTLLANELRSITADMLDLLPESINIHISEGYLDLEVTNEDISKDTVLCRYGYSFTSGENFEKWFNNELVKFKALRLETMLKKDLAPFNDYLKVSNVLYCETAASSVPYISVELEKIQTQAKFKTVLTQVSESCFLPMYNEVIEWVRRTIAIEMMRRLPDHFDVQDVKPMCDEKRTLVYITRKGESEDHHYILEYCHDSEEPFLSWLDYECNNLKTSHLQRALKLGKHPKQIYLQQVYEQLIQRFDLDYFCMLNREAYIDLEDKNGFVDISFYRHEKSLFTRTQTVDYSIPIGNLEKELISNVEDIVTAIVKAHLNKCASVNVEYEEHQTTFTVKLDEWDGSYGIVFNYDQPFKQWIFDFIGEVNRRTVHKG